MNKSLFFIIFILFCDQKVFCLESGSLLSQSLVRFTRSLQTLSNALSGDLNQQQDKRVTYQQAEQKKKEAGQLRLQQERLKSEVVVAENKIRKAQEVAARKQKEATFKKKQAEEELKRVELLKQKEAETAQKIKKEQEEALLIQKQIQEAKNKEEEEIAVQKQKEEQIRIEHIKQEQAEQERQLKEAQEKAQKIEQEKLRAEKEAVRAEAEWKLRQEESARQQEESAKFQKEQKSRRDQGAADAEAQRVNEASLAEEKRRALQEEALKIQKKAQEEAAQKNKVAEDEWQKEKNRLAQAQAEEDRKAVEARRARIAKEAEEAAERKVKEALQTEELLNARKLKVQQEKVNMVNQFQKNTSDELQREKNKEESNKAQNIEHQRLEEEQKKIDQLVREIEQLEKEVEEAEEKVRIAEKERQAVFERNRLITEESEKAAAMAREQEKKQKTAEASKQAQLKKDAEIKKEKEAQQKKDVERKNQRNKSFLAWEKSLKEATPKNRLSMINGISSAQLMLNYTGYDYADFSQTDDDFMPITFSLPKGEKVEDEQKKKEVDFNFDMKSNFVPDRYILTSHFARGAAHPIGGILGKFFDSPLRSDPSYFDKYRGAYTTYADKYQIDEIRKKNKNFLTQLIKNKSDLTFQLLMVAKILMGTYKIHVMPQTKKDLYDFLEKLNSSEAKKQLGGSIAQLAVMKDLPYDQKGMLEEKKLQGSGDGGPQSNLPVVIIYPSEGKENAQKALEVIFKIAKENGIKGADLKLNYNKKITNLIFYEQGDENKNAYKNYFEDDGAHYKSDAFKDAGLIAGKDRVPNFYLDEPPGLSKK